MRSMTLGLALTAAVIVAGCGGGSGTTPTAGAGSNSASESAVAATNAVGGPLNSLDNDNSSTSTLQAESRSAQSLALGVCVPNSGGGSYEDFSPDKNGDPNSTEQQYFYDNACAQLARDVVRIWTSTGASSETINRTAKIYPSGNTTPSAVRTDAVSLSNATFDQYGFPVAANGFARVDASNLQYNGTNAIDADYELVTSPLSGSSETFCSDAAGYNPNGIPSLGETFGWQGGVLAGGTRTVNGDGSVTWNSTHAGSTAKGAIGTLSIAIGTANTTCPISTPMFTLSGGTMQGAYSIPVVATYKAGLLTGLTISNASLANGTTLNVTTNTSVSPTSSQFISGTIANGATPIATFTVDAFGDGTLSVSSSGAQYVITDWQVVK
jgi:hypothetical protein